MPKELYLVRVCLFISLLRLCARENQIRQSFEMPKIFSEFILSHKSGCAQHLHETNRYNIVYYDNTFGKVIFHVNGILVVTKNKPTTRPIVLFRAQKCITKCIDAIVTGAFHNSMNIFV